VVLVCPKGSLVKLLLLKRATKAKHSALGDVVLVTSLTEARLSIRVGECPRCRCVILGTWVMLVCPKGSLIVLLKQTTQLT
jgi:hypothetical protein